MLVPTNGVIQYQQPAYVHLWAFIGANRKQLANNQIMTNSTDKGNLGFLPVFQHRNNSAQLCLLKMALWE